MEYNFDFWRRDYAIVIFCGVFFCSFLHAQSSSREQQRTSAHQNNQLTTLISKLKKEEEHRARKILGIRTRLELKNSKKIVAGTSLEDIGEDGTPLFYTTYSNPTGKTSRANTLHKGGLLNLDLDGKDMQVGVWDAGVALMDHQEYGGRSLSMDNLGEVNTHATMVTGALISSGVRERAKGVAHAAEALTYDWTRDRIEVAEAAANGMLLSNHSYGIKSSQVPDWYFGAYIRLSQDWDDIMYNAPYYLMVSAAGNSGGFTDNESPISGTPENGYDQLLGFNTSKNGLVVAGVNATIDDEGDLVNARIANYSSIGPIDDSRIKPDIGGNGKSVFTTTSEHTQSYGSSMGTSMAAPGVTGTLLLLQQYHKKLYQHYMKAATLKGVVLHTADDVDVAGPDYKMGWGVLNAKKAAQLIQNKQYTTLVAEEQLSQGELYSILVKANGTEPLSASISWTDPKGTYINRGEMNNNTPVLTNDLDIRVSKNGIIYNPWTLSASKAHLAAQQGDNTADPYERIDILEPSGEYTITVTHKGILAHAEQDFSLIVSGVTLTNCQLDNPSNLHFNNLNATNTQLKWDGSMDALFEVQYKKQDSEEWQITYTDKDYFDFPPLVIGQTYILRLRGFCTENVSSAFTNEYRFTFNGENTEPLLELQPLIDTLDAKIAIYPNPVANEINILKEFMPETTYQIVTIMGNVIKSGKLTGAIKVADLATGIYVLVLNEQGVFKSAKFYKE